jgi:hypothetical protein
MENPLNFEAANSKPKLTAEEWLDANLIQPYTNYDDKAPLNWLLKLLNEPEMFEEYVWDQMMAWNLEDDEYHRQEFLKLYGEDEEYLPQVATDSYIKKLLSNSNRVNVVIYPKVDSERIQAPASYDYTEEANVELRQGLMDVLGYTEKQALEVEAENTYSGTHFAVCGKIDWLELYEKRSKLKAVRVRPSDSVIFHCGYNGSGGAVEFPIAAEKLFTEFDIRVDEEMRYGVDATFGLVGAFWRNQLDLVYEAEPETDTQTLI